MIVGGPVRGSVSIPCPNPEPERVARVKVTDDGPGPVESNLDAVPRQENPFAAREQLDLVGIGTRHVIPLQIDTPYEYNRSSRLAWSVWNSALGKYD